MPRAEPLPIDEHLAAIVAAVRTDGALVLVAEPGAGKTTRVPRALLESGLAGDGEVVVLEPRRLAARMSARRVADELGEPVGERVGYQVRFEDVSSARTKLRFVTEGVLTRRLVADPTLTGVSVVVLDELHERHLHADLALALTTRLRQTARRDLRVVAMSATLDAEAAARFLGCSVLRVPGRPYDVAIEHLAQPDDRPLERQVSAAVRRLVQGGLDGDVLVFLPGASEIRRAGEACAEVAAQADLDVVALHGDLPVDEQERVLRPSPRRKVILSTNIAETSLTLPGVVAVVDSGLARVARHSPWSGLPRLDTARVSQASATQRAGRAGRTRPGRCLRLYTRADFDGRPAHDAPEIRRADLAELVLSLRADGIRPLELAWLEPPPEAAVEAAERLLTRLGALTSETRALTSQGRRMVDLPLHPRLARLVLEGLARGVADEACLVAALLGEREIRLEVRGGPRGARAALDVSGPSDLLAQLEAFSAVEREGLTPDRIRRHGLDVGAVLAAARARDQIARALGRAARRGKSVPAATVETEAALQLATLTAFPDRVARRRAPRSDEVLLAGGGGAARMADTSVVRESELLVAVDAEEPRRGATPHGQPRPIVRLASAIDAGWLLDLYPDHLEDRTTARFDAAGERVEVVSSLTYDGLVLDETRRTDVVSDETARVLADAALAAGLGAVTDSEALDRWRARVDFAATVAPEVPRVDDQAVRRALVTLCAGRRSFAELRDASLVDAVRAALAPRQLALVEKLAPDRVTLPGGRRARVEYPSGQAPFIASRLQDFFGLADGPRVADGRVPLVLHLLAPNQRAVQVTTDLAGFWSRHYPSIRKELMRRYPRHAWPEDPLHAEPPARR